VLIVRSSSLHAQRGQTFPIWAFGTLTVLLLMAFAISYGSLIQWQMRAQNAADAAAQGMLAVQTTQWNQTTSTLHAAAVEEFRLRLIMNDLLQVIRGSGGCNNAPGATGPTSCNQMYVQLRQAYFDSLQRYTNDVALIHRISAPTFANQAVAISNALQTYQSSANCGKPSGGDCAFQYSLLPPVARANSFVENVYADCCGWTIGGNTIGNPKGDLTPMNLQIVTCANVKWPIPSFPGFHPPAYTAIGRAAATSIMVTQEFMYVGSLENNKTGNAVFQPTEYPETASNTAAIPSNSDFNYRIDFGGNPDNTLNNGNPLNSDGVSGFSNNAPTTEGLQVGTGWWGSMAIKPSGSIVQGTDYTCK
jgi:hypothetical protein